MNDIDVTIESIRQFADAHKIRPSRLAKLANLHVNTLRLFREKEWNPTRATISALQRAIAAYDSREPGAQGTGDNTDSAAHYNVKRENGSQPKGSEP